MTGDGWTLRVDAPETTADEAIQGLFDDLVEWCEKRYLFVGGRHPSWVVYSPLAYASKATFDLRRFLTDRASLSVISKLGDLTENEAVDLTAAYIEAVSSAQRFLAERMSESADSLATLVIRR